MKRIHSLALLSATLVAGLSLGATAVFGQANEDAVATGGRFPLAAPAGVDSFRSYDDPLFAPVLAPRG